MADVLRQVDGGRRFLYILVSYTNARGRVIRPGLSLVQAYRMLDRLGRGAIFRAEGMSAYARPVYPILPGNRRRPTASTALGTHTQGRAA